MKTKLLALLALTIATFSCSNDELDINLNTSGSATLVLTDGNQPLANSEVRVALSYSDTDFQRGNLFEGTTNSNGEINTGALNSGNYVFRADLGATGLFFEQFQVVSGSDITRVYNIKDFQSDATFKVTNVNSAILSEVDFYLVPASINTTNVETSQVIEKSIAGTFASDEISFINVITGSYKLMAVKNNTLIVINAGYYYGNNFYVERDNDLILTVTLPSSLVLSGRSFQISNTQSYNGSTVSNVLSSVSFNGDETVTITDASNTSFTSIYSSSQYSDGTITINTNINYPPLTGVEYIYNISLSATGSLSINYRDASYNEFYAYFN